MASLVENYEKNFKSFFKIQKEFTETGRKYEELKKERARLLEKTISIKETFKYTSNLAKLKNPEYLKKKKVLVFILELEKSSGNSDKVKFGYKYTGFRFEKYGHVGGYSFDWGHYKILEKILVKLNIEYDYVKVVTSIRFFNIDKKPRLGAVKILNKNDFLSKIKSPKQIWELASFKIIH